MSRKASQSKNVKRSEPNPLAAAVEQESRDGRESTATNAAPKPMASDSERPRSRDVKLVLLGSIFALVSSIVVGFVNYALGLNRLSYEKKLDAYSDYSKIFNGFLQDTERTIEAGNEGTGLFDQWPNVNKDQLAAVAKDIADRQNKIGADIGSINAQVFLVNAVFDEQLPPFDQNNELQQLGLNFGPLDTLQKMREANVKVVDALREKRTSWRNRFTADMQRLSREISQTPGPGWTRLLHSLGFSMK